MNCARGFALFAVLVVASCTCPDADEPCLDWFSKNDRVRVEILGGVDAELDPHDVPFGGWPVPGDTCGTNVAPAPGDVLLFELEELVVDGNDCGTCSSALVTVEMPGVQWGALEPSPRSTFTYLAGREATVDLDQGCAGVYTLGISEVRDRFLEGDVIAESDYMLYRSLYAPEGCAGIFAPGSFRCADAWFVRVTTESGRQLTDDRPQ